MRKYPVLLGAAALTAALITGCSSGDQTPAADLILKNGRIYTVDDTREWAQAIVVSGDKIVYVGDDAGAQAYENDGAQVVDLQGKMVTPGFIDGHNHAYLMAESLFWLNLDRHRTVEDKQAALRAYRAENPAMPQLRGVGWDDIAEDARARGVLPRQLIDAAVPDIPVAIIENSHHTLPPIRKHSNWPESPRTHRIRRVRPSCATRPPGSPPANSRSSARRIW